MHVPAERGGGDMRALNILAAVLPFSFGATLAIGGAFWMTSSHEKERKIGCYMTLSGLPLFVLGVWAIARYLSNA